MKFASLLFSFASECDKRGKYSLTKEQKGAREGVMSDKDPAKGV